MKTEDFIECPRFGGTRPAPACVYYDRYKACRKTCASLEKHLKVNPGLVGKALKKKKRKAEKSIFAGKGLPNSKLRCPYCTKFIAKSIRGLKTHCTRTHKKRLPGD